VDKEIKKDLGRLAYFLRNKKVKKDQKKKIASACRYIDGMLVAPQAYNKAAVEIIKKKFGFIDDSGIKKRTFFEKKFLKNLKKGIAGIC